MSKYIVNQSVEIIEILGNNRRKVRAKFVSNGQKTDNPAEVLRYAPNMAEHLESGDKHE
jgi:hypothetical protein